MKCACGRELLTGDTDGECIMCRSRITYCPDMLEINMNQKGWECPKCGRIYAPYVPECHICNHDKPITGTTGG